MPELTCPLQSTPVQSYVHHSMPSPITYHKAIHHKTIYLIFDEERNFYFDVELSYSKTNIIIDIDDVVDDDDDDDDDDKPCECV